MLLAVCDTLDIFLTHVARISLHERPYKYMLSVIMYRSLFDLCGSMTKFSPSFSKRILRELLTQMF